MSAQDISPVHTRRAMRLRLVRTYEVPEIRARNVTRSKECVFHDDQVDVDIPPELESLIGMSMIFILSLKKDQMCGPTSAYNVMRVIRDEALVDAYYSTRHDTQEKDLISRMIEEDDNGSSDSDQEGSKGNEVNTPANASQERGNETNSVNSHYQEVSNGPIFYINQTEEVKDGHLLSVFSMFL
nr:replication factor A protein 1-like [Ipomoea batatas]